MFTFFLKIIHSHFCPKQKQPQKFQPVPAPISKFRLSERQLSPVPLYDASLIRKAIKQEKVSEENSEVKEKQLQRKSNKSYMSPALYTQDACKLQDLIIS